MLSYDINIGREGGGGVGVSDLKDNNWLGVGCKKIIM